MIPIKEKFIFNMSEFNKEIPEQNLNPDKIQLIIDEVLAAYKNLPMPRSRGLKDENTEFTTIVRQRAEVFSQIMDKHSVTERERARINVKLGKIFQERKKAKSKEMEISPEDNEGQVIT